MSKEFKFRKEQIWPLGTKVYPIKLEEEVHREKCPICKGSGKLTVVRNKEKLGFECPACGGDGCHSEMRFLWKVPKLSDYRIGGYRVESIANSALGRAHDFEFLHIEYELVNSYTYYNHEDCFLSKEMAEAECKIRNNEIERRSIR